MKTLVTWLVFASVYFLVGWQLAKLYLPHLYARRDKLFPEETHNSMGYKYANDNIRSIFIWIVIAWPMTLPMMFIHNKFIGDVEGHDPAKVRDNIRQLEAASAKDKTDAAKFIEDFDRELAKDKQYD